MGLYRLPYEQYGRASSAASLGLPAGDLVEQDFCRRGDGRAVVGRDIGSDADVVVFRAGDRADELGLHDVELRAVAAERRAARRAEAAGRLRADDRRALVLLEPGSEHLGGRAAAVVEDDRDGQLVRGPEAQILVGALRAGVAGLHRDLEGALPVQEP